VVEPIEGDRCSLLSAPSPPAVRPSPERAKRPARLHARCARAKPASKPVTHFLHAAVPDRRRMRQYGCEQERTKTSSRRDADAARDAGGRCAPRRPRPHARNVRGGRAMRTHVSRSSRGNRSDVPRSPVTSTRKPACARCRSRTARVSRSIVSSSPCAWDGGRWRGGRTAQVSRQRIGGSSRTCRRTCCTRSPRCCPHSGAIANDEVRRLALQGILGAMVDVVSRGASPALTKA
jgi:hypothetical protein